MEASTPQSPPSPKPPQRPPRPSKAEEVDQPDREGQDLIQAVAADRSLSDVERADALDWFMSDDNESFTHVMQLNVGNPKKANWRDWEIRPIDMDTLRRIRKQSTTKGARRGDIGDLDEVEINLRIVVEGTVTPDLKVAAKNKGIIDPADALSHRFRMKPGLVGQIAGEIMSISGYDEADVREVEAAGNS